MVLGWDFQHGWHGLCVAVDHVSDQLGDVLVDEDDVHIVAFDEALEAVFDFADGRIWKTSGGDLLMFPYVYTYSCPLP